MTIEEANDHREAIVALLMLEKLPVNDLPRLLENFVAAIDHNKLAGVAGLEIYGSYCLLRSLAVLPEYRGQGIARALLTEIEGIAAREKIQEIFLLTETAREYFLKKGYELIAKDDVPVEVRRSSEFSHVCPQSAFAMKKTLVVIK